MPRIIGLLDRAAVRLAQRGCASARLDAEVLLSHALGIGRAALVARREESLPAAAIVAFEAMLARREARVPVAYLVGIKEFWSLEFEVNESVLIPRPETEIVVEEALRLLGQHGTARPPEVRCVGGITQNVSRQSGSLAPGAPPRLTPPVVVDVGTGAGPIVVALARERPDAILHATDISRAALEIARRNAGRHGVAGRIRFHGGDLLSPVLGAGLAGRIDLVASNPPYVGYSESVDEDVRLWEPREAVYGGAGGAEVIERLVPQAARALAPDAWLVMEIAPAREASVRRLLAEGGVWRDVSVRSDLAGLPRVVTARRAGREVER